MNLPPAQNKSGDQIVSRQYNQRTKQWDVKLLKANKGYEYIPVLMATILYSRNQDVNIVGPNASLNESDPRLIAPTTAAKPPPPTKDLLQRRSRFEMSSKAPHTENNEPSPATDQDIEMP